MPGVWLARSLVRKVREHASSSPQVSQKRSGIPCTMVLTVSFVVSLVIGLSCHHRPREALASQELDASVEASGPHDFAVRIRAVRCRRVRVHRIPFRVS